MVARVPSFVALNVLVLFLHPWPAMAQSQPGSDWLGPWHMWAAGWGFWWILPVLMFGFVIVLCALVMFRGPWSHRDQHRDTTTSALTLLSERFAKGDISKEEFEEKKAILARRA